MSKYGEEARAALRQRKAEEREALGLRDGEPSHVDGVPVATLLAEAGLRDMEDARTLAYAEDITVTAFLDRLAASHFRDLYCQRHPASPAQRAEADALINRLTS